MVLGGETPNGYVPWNGQNGYLDHHDSVVAALALGGADRGAEGDPGALMIDLPHGDKQKFLDASGSTTPTACCDATPEVKDAGSDYAGPTWRAHVTLILLLLANLLNYMDRYTIAGVLGDIQKYFYGIDNTKAGLLQTSFICSYMVLSPIFGYLGDRYNRKLIMAVGILFWSGVTLAGSFVNRDQFWLFLFLRGMVGIGEASYSTIAPTLIADLFVKNQRTMALTIFYFAIPVGSGLGYIVGSFVAKAMGAWYWSLRVTPPLGVLCSVLIMFVVKEPARGAAEGGSHLGQTAWIDDLKYLAKNMSFIFCTLGFTCVAFVAGALSLWAPKFMVYSILVQGEYSPEAEVALNFGLITCLAGFLGVAIGTGLAGQLRKKTPRADPLVCAGGLLVCAPFLYLSLFISKFHTKTTWVLIFLGETALCLNWALVTDILLYSVIPTRRSTAEAFQILFSHLLGDAGSPSLVGVVSDKIRLSLEAGNNTMGAPAREFIGLQSALYTCCFVAVIGGGFFLANALYLVRDRNRADAVVKAGLAARSPEQSRMITEVPASEVTTDIQGRHMPNGTVPTV